MEISRNLAHIIKCISALPTHLTSVLGWKAAGLSCGENFGTMSDGAEAEDAVDGEEDAAEEGGGVAEESAAGTANRLRTRSRN